MLVMLVTLLSRHKSSFSYLPHLLPASAIISTHTVSPHLLLFHLLQNTETETSNLCVAREHLLLCFFQGKMLWETFLGIFGYRSASVPPATQKAFLGSGCLRAPQMQHCSWLTTFLSLFKIPLFISPHSLSQCQKRVQSFSGLKTGTRET